MLYPCVWGNYSVSGVDLIVVESSERISKTFNWSFLILAAQLTRKYGTACQLPRSLLQLGTQLQYVRRWLHTKVQWLVGSFFYLL